MKDLHGREIDYMRISITDRCNLRCKYCMPKGVELLPMAELLTFEEIQRVCHEAVSLGITKFKITGGEPLVRRGCVELIRSIKQMDGVEQVTMTTNGILLGRYLPQLTAAGLDGVNISLDTRKERRFEEITGFPQLATVLQSIDMAVQSGIPVKINTVLQSGVNEDEWRNLLELARNLALDVRFIELMPIGFGKKEQMVSNEQLLRQIQAVYPDMVRDERVHGNGPAIYYKIPGFQGSIGLISAIHGVFCASCNRIRMTSTGELKPCLCYQETFSVRAALRKGTPEQVRAILRQAIEEKPERHCFEKQQTITEQKAMVQIGG
ncbi:MAG: GTP 3',8-cyclase MoaA [Lachnospiraceae bacterium]